ncbi:dihydrodipicolinate synthase family protein [Phytomonospora endophytica]|uniref:4-hydroxy-tetrahydrodipicolinate synthase n=1 Tax=Phytomonospora endophytica TaxID=714109 RepID=A0A841G0N9_9ACTN|nr:dihydrodipicolinate synthase family protein [Phytomonospora endophytica]MBB6038249.1 4-hydroxy-tetrahydrodipicolinate synthase [Phytomonospora endophytica]GIG67291.1 dihydrodipicolinate synthase family protein [Phytomonospora endophytica]
MYQGTIVPLVTPLTETGEVSSPCVARLVDSVRDEVTAVMPALSSGEGWLLDAGRWRDMVAATVTYAAGLPVLAGIQLPTTGEVVARARTAAELGADAVVVTTPFDPELDQDAVYRHYATVREGTALPIFLYNEHAISGNHIALDTIVRICALPGVAGIKESSGSPELTRRIAAAVPHVPVFEGWENLLLDVLSGDAGVAGFVGPLANLEPALCSLMLREPSAEVQAEINAACERLGLFKDDWYRWAKAELRRRAVIDSDRTVEWDGAP